MYISPFYILGLGHLYRELNMTSVCMPLDGILSTIVSLDPGAVNGYAAGISSFKCTERHCAPLGCRG